MTLQVRTAVLARLWLDGTALAWKSCRQKATRGVTTFLTVTCPLLRTVRTVALQRLCSVLMKWGCGGSRDAQPGRLSQPDHKGAILRLTTKSGNRRRPLHHPWCHLPVCDRKPVLDIELRTGRPF